MTPIEARFEMDRLLVDMAQTMNDGRMPRIVDLRFLPSSDRCQVLACVELTDGHEFNVQVTCDLPCDPESFSFARDRFLSAPSRALH